MHRAISCAGPPGTGKTVTSASIVYQLAKLGQGQVRNLTLLAPDLDTHEGTLLPTLSRFCDCITIRQDSGRCLRPINTNMLPSNPQSVLAGPFKGLQSSPAAV